MENQKSEALTPNYQQNGTSKRQPEYTKNLYEDARTCSIKILCRCERTDSYLEKLIDAELRNDTLNDFDKALLNEISHGVIRWMRRLDWFLNGFYRGNYEKCLPEVRNAMRIALYQILFLNKIPYSAAVNESVEYIKRIHGEKHAGVVNGLLRTIIRTLDNLVWPTREIDEVNYLGLVQSHPNWMVRRWINRFGFDDAVKLCEANNKRPVMSLRVNRLKISNTDFENYLSEKNLYFKKGNFLDNFFSTKTMSKIYTDELFRNGYFTIQDESAGLVSKLVDPKKDELILDLCSAPGGKTSHMSELYG
ncbi:MAG: transcription antitermination factor NusB [Ignavibacteria bacterium]